MSDDGESVDIAAALHLLGRCGNDAVVAAANDELVKLLCERLSDVALHLTSEERGDLAVELAPTVLRDETRNSVVAASLVGTLAATRVQLTPAAATALIAALPALDIPLPLALEAWARSHGNGDSVGWPAVLESALVSQQPQPSPQPTEGSPSATPVKDAWAALCWEAAILPITPAASANMISFTMETQGSGAEEWLTVHSLLDFRSPASERFPLPGALRSLLDAAAAASWSAEESLSLRDEVVDRTIDWAQRVVESAMETGDVERSIAAQSLLLALLYNEPEMLEGKCVQQALRHPDLGIAAAAMSAVANPKAVVYALRAPLAQVALSFSAVTHMVNGDLTAASDALYWLGVSHPVTMEAGAHARPSTPAMREELAASAVAGESTRSGGTVPPASDGNAAAASGTRLKLSLRGAGSGGAASPKPAALGPRWSQDSNFLRKFVELVDEEEGRRASGGATVRSATSSLPLRGAPRCQFLRELIADPQERHRIGGLATLTCAAIAHAELLAPLSPRLLAQDVEVGRFLQVHAAEVAPVRAAMQFAAM